MHKSGRSQPLTSNTHLSYPHPNGRPCRDSTFMHHLEFVYGNDVANGHLQIRKIFSDRAGSALELFRRDEMLEFQRLPGYVVCNDCEGD